MKKLIAAAVATSVSAIALADVSITGNAKFEYFNDQVGTAASTNKTNTEVNLSVKGKTGDTSLVMNLEFNGHGSVDTGTHTVTTTTTSNSTTDVHTSTSTVSQRNGGTLDIEDLYMTTKVGDINVKAGNYASGTSALLGEIDNGGRATNKIDLSTKVGGATVYMGNTGAGTTGENHTGSTALDANMYAGISMDVAGNTVQFKKVKENTDGTGVDAWGIKGSVANVDYRLEQKMDNASNGDTTFGELKTSVSGVSLGYAWIDADKPGKVTEDDSAIFAVEMATAGGVARSNAKGQKQLMASTSLEGNTVTIKSGSIEHGLSASKDLDYMQIGVSRKLASGANAVVTYTSQDTGSTGTDEKDTLEVELNVSF